MSWTDNSRNQYNRRKLRYSSDCTDDEWDDLPKDFSPFITVQYHFYRLRDNGLLDIMHEALVVFMRLIEGETEQPCIGMIESQSEKKLKVAAL